VIRSYYSDGHGNSDLGRASFFIKILFGEEVKNFEKRCIHLVALFLCTSYVNENLDVQNESNLAYIGESTIFNEHIFDYEDSKVENFATKEDISQHLQDVKEEFFAVVNDDSIFPSELIYMMAEALFNLCDLSPQNPDNIMNSKYFDLVKTLGAGEFEMTDEELYLLFPELQER